MFPIDYSLSSSLPSLLGLFFFSWGTFWRTDILVCVWMTERVISFTGHLDGNVINEGISIPVALSPSWHTTATETNTFFSFKCFLCYSVVSSAYTLILGKSTNSPSYQTFIHFFILWNTKEEIFGANYIRPHWDMDI